MLLQVSPNNIDNLLRDYPRALLSEDRKEFVRLLLLKKTEIMVKIFGRKEAENVY